MAISEILSAPVTEFLHVQPFIADQGQTGVFGQSGCGKTQFATAVTLATASGKTIAGIEPRQQGAVLYLDGERSFALRLRAAAHAYGIDPATLPIFSIAGEMLDTFKPESIDDLIGACQLETVRPLLTVIDTGPIFQTCDENTSDMNQVVRNLHVLREQLGCAVLSLMHPSKGNADSERGGNQFRGAADVMLKAAHQDGTLTITVDKNRFGPQGEEFRYRMVEVPEIDKGVALRAASDAIDTSVTDRDLAAFAALPTEGASFTEWCALAEVGGLSSQQFARSLKRLVALDRVRKKGEVYRRA